MSRGLGYLKLGFTFLARNPRLWIYALVPFLLGILLFGIVFGIFLHHYDVVYNTLLHWVGPLGLKETPNFGWKILAALLWLLNQFLRLLIFLIGMILVSIFSTLALMIVSAPVNDLLSEKVETLLTGVSPPPFSWKYLLTTMSNEIKKAALMIVIPIALLVLNIIPVAGGVLYSMLIVLFGCWNIGFNFVDLSMARQRLTLGQRLKIAGRHRWMLIGFGIPFLIPFAPLFLQAPMVVGGTLLYQKEMKDAR